eukprot:scaffold47953_cov73-Phaeocystis_antarctica.AAC.3
MIRFRALHDLRRYTIPECASRLVPSRRSQKVARVGTLRSLIGLSPRTPKHAPSESSLRRHGEGRAPPRRREPPRRPGGGEPRGALSHGPEARLGYHRDSVRRCGARGRRALRAEALQPRLATRGRRGGRALPHGGRGAAQERLASLRREPARRGEHATGGHHGHGAGLGRRPDESDRKAGRRAVLRAPGAAHLRPDDAGGASPALARHRAPRSQAGECLLHHGRAAVDQADRPRRRGRAAGGRHRRRRADRAVRYAAVRRARGDAVVLR